MARVTARSQNSGVAGPRSWEGGPRALITKWNVRNERTPQTSEWCVRVPGTSVFSDSAVPARSWRRGWGSCSLQGRP